MGSTSGTASDARIGVALGRSRGQVRQYRIKLGIPICEYDRSRTYRAAMGIVTLCPQAMRERRQQLGLLQCEVAARAGLHPVTYTALESGGRRNVQGETLGKLAVALECSPESLLDGLKTP